MRDELSKPARSAVVTMSRLFGQVISRCPGAVVAAQPLLTLAPKTPSLSRLSLYSGFRARRSALIARRLSPASIVRATARMG